MEDLKGGQAGVNFAHQTLHEDDITEADAEVGEETGKGHEIIEVVELHGIAKIEGEVAQVGAFVTQLLQHRDGNQVAVQLQVAQSLSRALVDEVEEVLHCWNL